jgi:hypothetical protein
VIHCGVRCYRVLEVTGCIPDLLHDHYGLLDRNVPRVDGLTDERHISWDKGVPEPPSFNPMG